MRPSLANERGTGFGEVRVRQPLIFKGSVEVQRYFVRGRPRDTHRPKMTLDAIQCQ